MVIGVPADPRVLEQYEEAGFRRAVHWLPSATAAPVERALERFETARSRSCTANDARRQRRRFAAARVARLATADAAGSPTSCPIVFVAGQRHDLHRGRPQAEAHDGAARLANVAANPAASVLVDHYDDADWSDLWWVRADGAGRVLEAVEPEAQRAIDLLAERYPQHRDDRPQGPVLAIDVVRWSGWSSRQGD